jgi:3-dehydroquinate dehydratase-1
MKTDCSPKNHRLALVLPRIAFRAGRKELTLGTAPLVVGTLSSLFTRLSARKLQGACDLVEVRLDHTPRPQDWQQRCAGIEKIGWPVILTVRHAGEGGSWDGTEEARLSALKWGVEHLAGVDVELRSRLATPVARLAKKSDKVCIVSFHDFDQTPSLKKLQTIATQAGQLGSIVKISTRIEEAKDVETLHSLLSNRHKRPLCVIGMGEDWQETRISFALHGSCLTYGYLDSPAAPGQIPAKELKRRLARRRIR